MLITGKQACQTLVASGLKAQVGVWLNRWVGLSLVHMTFYSVIRIMSSVDLLTSQSAALSAVC